jgi:LuxR family maltose regulon positive regulatory protein
VQRPLTLISAPAGSGKTSLLAEWLAVGNPPGPVARVALDDETDGTRDFWTAVHEAARAVAPELAGAVVPSRDVLAGLETPLVVVLDDFQLIRSPAVARDLDWLVERGGGVRLLISTRSDPPLRLERLRLGRSMSELRAADLAFTLAETEDLMGALELSGEDVQLLWRRTEGWIAGLRIAQLSLERRDDRHTFVTTFAGEDRAVSDYLISEVVDRQPADTLDFLLRTCVVDRLSGELADELTGGHEGDRALRALERGGGLVSSIDGHGRWHRYHPLLLEVLRAESRRRLPVEQRPLHARAARWHARCGSALEAARHAVAAGDWDLAREVVRESWLTLSTRGGGPQLLELAELIPAQVVRADPELALALAGLRLEAGDDAGAEELLTEAGRLAGRLPEWRARRFEVTSAAIALYRARLRGDVQAALSAARSALSEDWGADLGAEVRALTLANLGIAELWDGSAESAGVHLQQAAGLARECANDFLLFLAESYAAALDVTAGRLSEASARADVAIRLAERHHWTDASHAAMAYCAQGSVQLWRGRLAEAHELGERAAAALIGSREPLLGQPVALLRATLTALRGDPLTALDMVRGATARGPVPRLVAVPARRLESELQLALGEPERARVALAELTDLDAAVCLARLELAEGNPEAAIRATAALLTAEREPDVPFARVEASVLAAIAHDALRDEDEALAALERGLDMAEPRGCSVVLLRYGAPLRSLLSRLRARGTRHRALVDDLLERLAGTRAREPAAAPLLEPLSDRELTVLRYLPTMMSNADIAAEMFVSVNTVKTHLKHVYRKLDVTGRRDCVKRGRELRLLSPGVGER